MSTVKQKDILNLSRKVSHDYHILETIKAGIVLDGWMVKSLRQNKVSTSGIPFVRPQNTEMFLYGLTIKPLSETNSFSETNTTPVLKLLLNRREIDKLIGAEERQGHTVVVTRIYFEGHLVKVDIALAKGKQNRDKRADVKERDDKRSMARATKLAR